MNNSVDNSTIRILVIDDEQMSRECIVSVLASEQFQVMQAPNAADGLSLTRKYQFDLVITDLRIGEDSGIDVIRTVQSTFPDTEIILITGYGTIESAVEAIQAGAFDYLTKPFSNQHLLVKVNKAVERKQMKREITVLRQHVAMNYGFDNIVGISKVMTQLKETAQRVAPTDITILITGPSGTGKELFARAIHHHSNRRTGSFVAVDCSAIPETLLESELFGHLKGSFTNAYNAKKGLFEEAHEGTLFLDEVSNIPMATQAKLLRFLQESEIRPVGATESKKVNVRIVAATNRDLKTMVQEGIFREDLYFRLSVIPLNLPPLIERPEDIEMLIDYFLRKISHDMKGHTVTITRRAVDKMLGHKWPGNVRELENALKRGAALCQDNQIDINDVIFIAGERPAVESEAPTRMSITFRGGRLDAEQRSLIVKSLAENDWNFTRTAQELGIGRTTLWRKIKKYNLTKLGVIDEVEV